jgi:pimeloyl-ACP methyl ester carboxylesterase
MHVHEWGRRDDVPLFFWHALGPDVSGADVAPIAPALIGCGFHVLGVDGPGFGRSRALQPDAYRLEALVELLHGLIDDRELERPVLMGHSWGGAVCVSYAGTYPADVRGLVLLDSGHIDYRDLPGVDPARPLEEWVAEVSARPDPRRAEARAMAMQGLTAPISRAWRELATHEIPTLLFLATEPPHGDQNREHVGRFRAAVPHADVRWADGAGHGILDDVGAPLGEEIAAWLVEQGL